MKNNRHVALWLCVAVLFVMLFTSFYSAHETDHHCIGEGCEICAQIENCRQHLETLFAAVTVSVLALALSYNLITLFFCFAGRISQNSLVALKVKLSN